MTGAVKTDKNIGRAVEKKKLYSEPSIKYINVYLFDILTQIHSSIKYYLKKSDKQKLTDEQRHKILQNLAGNEDIFKKLTDEEKLKILEKLFVGDEEKLKNLSDTEKLGNFDELLKGNEEEAVEKLSDKEKNKIFNDLFLGEEGKLDSSFLYKGKGAELYAKISEDASYPFIKIEKDYLENLHNNKEFKKILEKCKYITDVGCGDGQKAISLLKEADRKGIYYAEDYSMGMLDRARNKIKENAPEINLGGLVVLEPGKKNLLREFNNNMYLFLGGTICNMTDEQIIDILKKMDNNGIISGNKILLSYFTAPNTLDEIKNLIEIYNSKSNKDFHENGMDMLGLSEDDFEYDTIYELDNGTKLKLENGELKPYEGTLNDLLRLPFSGKIKGIIRAKRDFELKLNSGGKKEIKAGEEFTLHYSRRFTKEKIEDLFKKSGCTTNFNDTEEGVSITLLSKKPTKLKTLTKRYKDLLLVTLSLTLGVGIGSFGINKYNKEQYILEQERYEKERIEMRDHYRNETTKGTLGYGEGELLCEYFEEQSNILMAEYNISNLNQETDFGEVSIINNDIIEMYRNAFSIRIGEIHKKESLMSKLYTSDLTNQEFQELFGYLTAEEFMKLYGGQIIDKYHIPYQRPYEHFKQYKDIIKNTLKYGNKIDISKYKTEEIPTKSELSYFMKYDNNLEYTQPHGWFRLKPVRVDLGNGKKIDLFIADKNMRHSIKYEGTGDYTLKDGYECMKNLSSVYPYVLSEKPDSN